MVMIAILIQFRGCHMRCSRVFPQIFAAIALLIAGLPSACCEDRAKTVLVHYMPWYASRPVSGQWGWHWTMNRFNPENVKSDGVREIASHDSPLIGPYDSGDEDLLECHVLLMKFAGLNGVVIDWYGLADFRDYAMIHRNTQRLIAQVKKAGLQFAICYEDQSVKHIVENGHLPKGEEVAEGVKAVTWLSENCFGDAAYVKLNGRPILIIFGPQHFTAVQLQTVMSVPPNRPVLFGLPHLVQNAGMDGAFGWPPVTGGREISRETWTAYLHQLHARDQVISIVFPGFRDIYKEAGLHDSYGFIDGRDGRTFNESLTLARNSRSPFIQIATWNDYGEGTVIEPTVGNGYRYLEALQATWGKRHPFTADDLRLPVRLYNLRKQGLQTLVQRAELQKASDFLFAGNCEAARLVLDAAGRGGEQGRVKSTED